MIGKLQGDRALLLGAVGIFSLGLLGSGYLLGDGLRRAKSAERSISVRGVSERDVTANLATWTIAFSDEGGAVRRFFTSAGFKPGEVSDSGVSFSREHLTDKDGNAAGERIVVKRSI